jgi:hypothetical protein
VNREEEKTKDETPLRVDGFAQVLDMLRIADPSFRESLLKRLSDRDPALAQTLRKDLYETP